MRTLLILAMWAGIILNAFSIFMWGWTATVMGLNLALSIIMSVNVLSAMGCWWGLKAIRRHYDVF